MHGIIYIYVYTSYGFYPHSIWLRFLLQESKAMHFLHESTAKARASNFTRHSLPLQCKFNDFPLSHHIATYPSNESMPLPAVRYNGAPRQGAEILTPFYNRLMKQLYIHVTLLRRPLQLSDFFGDGLRSCSSSSSLLFLFLGFELLLSLI